MSESIFKKPEVSYVEREEQFVHPAFLEFLDADDYNQKYDIVCKMGDIMDDHLINQMAASIDVIIEDGELEDRILSLKRCISTKARYEGARR